MTESTTRRIGVLTGGGDCPGLNAVLRSIVIRGENVGLEVLGIEDGFEGLLPGSEGTVFRLTRRDVDPILDRGGTILGTTNRGNPFSYPTPSGELVDRSADVLASARKLGIDTLITIGGEGTQTIAHEFERRGLRVVGVPKTIDNDLAATYRSFGFATAVQVVSDALDRLRTTAESHERIMVLEVMGRDAGWIALASGIAGGAHVILVPEIPYSPRAVAQALRDRAQRGAGFGLVVVSEGAAPRGEEAPRISVVGPKAGHAPVLGGAGQRAAELLTDLLPEMEFRVTVLGHLQRGGTPVAADRILSTRLGVEAVNAVADGEHGILISWRPPEVVRVPLTAAIKQPRLLDPDSQLVAHARQSGICLGN